MYRWRHIACKEDTATGKRHQLDFYERSGNSTWARTGHHQLGDPRLHSDQAPPEDWNGWSGYEGPQDEADDGITSPHDEDDDDTPANADDA